MLIMSVQKGLSMHAGILRNKHTVNSICRAILFVEPVQCATVLLQQNAAYPSMKGYETILSATTLQRCSICIAMCEILSSISIQLKARINTQNAFTTVKVCFPINFYTNTPSFVFTPWKRVYYVQEASQISLSVCIF